jgi:hypothetical protein
MKTVQRMSIAGTRMALFATIVLFFGPQPCRSASAKLLAAPQWKIGDWFELKISRWRGYAIAYPPELTEWESPVIKHYEVVGEEGVFGYPCFVVHETSRPGVPGESVDGDWYFFRKSDLTLIRVKTRFNGGRNNTKWIGMNGQSPWVVGDIGLAPRFPVVAGTQIFPPTQLLDAKGRAVSPRSDWHQRTLEKTQGKTQRACGDRIAYGKRTRDVVQIEYGGHVCRWVPGQPWWAQCWQEPRLFGPEKNSAKRVSFYRAALYATSRDGILDYPLPNAAKGGVMLEQKAKCPPGGAGTGT